MFLALVTATCCSETETEIDPEPGSGGQVALGITPNLKVDAGTKAATKSVVSGEKITYTDYNSAPGLGVLVTNSTSTGWYKPDETGSGYTGHHVRYIGDGNGANWISITDKKSSYDQKNEVPYYLTKTVGKVYAYYPYNEDLGISSISSESNLKIQVKVLTTGEIDASTNNARKYWDVNKWSQPSSKGTPVNLSLSTENDYLYFDATESGRYVNNGRAEGQTPVTPEADPDNTNDKNPGYKINLNMKHAMAMVSFRVYDGGHLSDKDVKFTTFKIKNHTDGSSLFKTGEGYMSLTDGAITGPSTTTGMTRTITGYILMRQVEEGGKEGEHAFVQNGKTSSSVNGQTVSKTVSALVYPIESFDDNEIDVEITLQEGENPVVVYQVTLPANNWSAGDNYIYTFSAGRNKLTIMDVTVEKWNDVDQVEIPL